jgi:hypothetical protein
VAAKPSRWQPPPAAAAAAAAAGKRNKYLSPLREAVDYLSGGSITSKPIGSVTYTVRKRMNPIVFGYYI